MCRTMTFSVQTSNHIKGENKSVEGNSFGSIKVKVSEKAKHYFLHIDLIVGMMFWPPSILGIGEKYKYENIFNDINLHINDLTQCLAIHRKVRNSLLTCYSVD